MPAPTENRARRAGRVAPLAALVLGAALVAAGCGLPPPPVESAGSMRRAMSILELRHEKHPEFSVILDDMEEPYSGGAFAEPRHRYRVVYVDTAGGGRTLGEERTGWVKVEGEEFIRHEDHLGMTILSKRADRSLDTVPVPPAYAYVGDPRYGQWRTERDGDRFWEWYGQYALLRTLAGDGPILELDFDHYKKHRRSHAAAPYFGRKQQYGSLGSLTAKTRPDFHARRVAARASRSAAFDSRVDGRVGRSGMSGFRSRSGGYGGK